SACGVNELSPPGGRRHKPDTGTIGRRVRVCHVYEDLAGSTGPRHPASENATVEFEADDLRLEQQRQLAGGGDRDQVRRRNIEALQFGPGEGGRVQARPGSVLCGDVVDGLTVGGEPRREHGSTLEGALAE